MPDYEKYMRRCIELAALGKRDVAPNPMVGCVLVHKDKITGEGYHHAFGKAHAEVNAINSVNDKRVLKDCTLYVNLEPCSHYGKTPPCADLIIQSGIKKVVTGCRDPNEEVNGKGIRKLKENGVEVIENILENECRFMNRRFITFHKKKRPYIILKWAQSSDGFIAPLNTRSRKPFQISSKLSQTLVHRWRSEEQAIMVGTNTARNDNPQLNVRLWKGKNPVRIVIDKDLKLPASLNLFNGKQETLVFSEKKKNRKGRTEFIQVSFGNNLLNAIMENLFNRSIQSVIVEGGALLLQSFINRNLWDEARVFTSPLLLNNGVHAPSLSDEVCTPSPLVRGLGGEADELKIYYNRAK